jgi:hypothetical protein
VQVQNWERTLNAELKDLRGLCMHARNSDDTQEGDVSSKIRHLKAALDSVNDEVGALKQAADDIALLKGYSDDIAMIQGLGADVAILKQQQQITSERQQQSAAESRRDFTEEIRRLAFQDEMLLTTVSEIRQDLINLRHLDEDRSIQIQSSLKELRASHTQTHRELKSEVEAMFKGEMILGKQLKEVQDRLEERIEEVSRNGMDGMSGATLMDTDTSPQKLDAIDQEIKSLRKQDDMLLQRVSDIRREVTDLRQFDGMRASGETGARDDEELIRMMRNVEQRIEARLLGVQTSINGRIGMVEQTCAATSSELQNLESRLEGNAHDALIFPGSSSSSDMPNKLRINGHDAADKNSTAANQKRTSHSSMSAHAPDFNGDASSILRFLQAEIAARCVYTRVFLALRSYTCHTIHHDQPVHPPSLADTNK